MMKNMVNRCEVISYDLAYFAFILGYDLMHDELVKSWHPENDYCFDRCLTLAEEFMESDEYNDLSLSGYEALEEWIGNRKIKGYKYLLYTTTPEDLYGYTLEDNGMSENGGTAFEGEVLGEFVIDIDEDLYTPMIFINEKLKECGIKELTKRDIANYLRWNGKLKGE